MAQAVPQLDNTADRLARFRRLREQLAPARDPASALEAYVDRPHAVSRRIAAELELGPDSTHVVIGGVGSGKTTELLTVKKS
jgi:polynucleotide 5'-kinase involved in rRNA processing